MDVSVIPADPGYLVGMVTLLSNMDGFLQSGLLASLSFWLDPASYWAIARVVLGLGLVIFIHELGHFLVAKACGVKCDKFYVGFDAFDIKIGDRVIIPRSLWKWQWGETEYGIGILPLGGYVKMLGQDDNPANYQQELERSKQGDSQKTSEDAAIAQAGLIDRSKLDPRSFLAKSVLQRMAIISAGVIFNLISAVFFAAIAFKSGVNFWPAKIGSTIGGGPAWEHNLAGAEIKKIGESTTEDYFTWFNVLEHFVFNGDEKALPVAYVPYGASSSEKQTEIYPRKGLLRDNKDLALGGLSQRWSLVVAKEGINEASSAAHATVPLESGDKIVSVNGFDVKTDIDLRSRLIREVDHPVTFVVERTPQGKNSNDPIKERIETVVEPNPLRSIGFSLIWKPIASIQHGSPAEQAGLKVGDEIIKVDGQPRGNLLNLDKRLIRFARDEKPVDLEIKRGEEVLTVQVQPTFYLVPSITGENQPVPIDSIGVAVPIGLTIEEVETGSKAESAGLKVGDGLVSLKFLLNDQQKKISRYSRLSQKAIDFVKEETTYAELDDILQSMEVGTEVELEVFRGGANHTIKTQTEASSEYHQFARGVGLTSYEEHYKSSDWSSAFKYGSQQVVRDIRKVGETLLKLIRGKISPKNLGGPGTIAIVATTEASQGNSRLLLFLAFLSANLAVINLLPIPVLDGGHLLFLAYEGIFRRPVNEKTQILLTYIGLAMILSLMIFVVVLDIGRISSLLM